MSIENSVVNFIIPDMYLGVMQGERILKTLRYSLQEICGETTFLGFKINIINMFNCMEIICKEEAFTTRLITLFKDSKLLIQPDPTPIEAPVNMSPKMM